MRAVLHGSSRQVATGVLLAGLVVTIVPAGPTATASPVVGGRLAGVDASGATATAGRATAELRTPLRCPRTVNAAHVSTCLERARTAYVGAWRRELRRSGIAAPTPRLVVWAGQVDNPCVDLGEGDVVTASFYCDKNSTVYASRTAARFWTKAYAREAARVGVLASDAATARTTTANLRRGLPLAGATTELAHEAGHWVQHTSGQLRWYLKRIDSPRFARSNRYKLASELGADCLAGWVQGRVAAAGTWRDKGIDRWAQHATMAELGADLTGLSPGFRFPRETPPLIAYGGPYSRLRFYDLGHAAGVAHRRGLRICARAAAAYTHSRIPPNPR